MLNKRYSFDELNELGMVCIVKRHLLDICLALEERVPLLSLVLLHVSCEPADSLFFCPVRALYNVGRQGLHSVLGLIFSSLHVEDRVGQSGIDHFPLLV
jgi:hypothetical protein